MYCIVRTAAYFLRICPHSPHGSTQTNEMKIYADADTHMHGTVRSLNGPSRIVTSCRNFLIFVTQKLNTKFTDTFVCFAHYANTVVQRFVE